MRKLMVFLVVASLLCTVVTAASMNRGRSEEGNDVSLQGNDSGKGKPEDKGKSDDKGMPEDKGKPVDKGLTAVKANKTGGRGPVQAVKAVNQSMQKGSASGASIQARMRVVAKLQERVMQKQAEAGNETRGSKDKTKQFKNQNVVRERVMALHALRDEAEDKGIGEQVAEVASNFSDSIDKTQRAEEKINNRNWVRRLFLGGDLGSAQDIGKEVQLNRGRIMQLMQLRSGMSPEYKAFIDEQVDALNAEQDRLDGLSKKEKQSKGLLGWLYK